MIFGNKQVAHGRILWASCQPKAVLSPTVRSRPGSKTNCIIGQFSKCKVLKVITNLNVSPSTCLSAVCAAVLLRLDTVRTTTYHVQPTVVASIQKPISKSCFGDFSYTAMKSDDTFM